jgi:hypothetical protein
MKSGFYEAGAGDSVAVARSIDRKNAIKSGGVVGIGDSGEVDSFTQLEPQAPKLKRQRSA